VAGHSIPKDQQMRNDCP